MRRPRFVQVEQNRHGKEVVYFRREGGRRVRLPSLNSPLFNRSYFAALCGKDIEREQSPSGEKRRRILIAQAMKNGLNNAEKRSAQRGLPFALTFEWAMQKIEEQGYRCALTGIPFLLGKREACAKRPYSPSLDRIVPGLGYTPENVRIIVFALNVMLSDWGTETFERVARAYDREAKERTSIPAPSCPVRGNAKQNP